MDTLTNDRIGLINGGKDDQEEKGLKKILKLNVRYF